MGYDWGPAQVHCNTSYSDHFTTTVEHIYSDQTDTTGATVELTYDVTVEPTYDVTVGPTYDVTVEPTYDVTVEPTYDVTVEPTSNTTVEPTSNATVEPTTVATVEPTTVAKVKRTSNATVEPTFNVTAEPTSNATVEPTSNATAEPTSNATVESTSNATVESTSNAKVEHASNATVELTFNVTVESTSDATIEHTSDGTEPTSDETYMLPSDETDIPRPESTVELLFPETFGVWDTSDEDVHFQNISGETRHTQTPGTHVWPKPNDRDNTEEDLISSATEATMDGSGDDEQPISQFGDQRPTIFSATETTIMDGSGDVYDSLCAPITGTLELTDTIYRLPMGLEGSVWESPQTCARGGDPIFTFECRRDNTDFMSWGSPAMNPLCDYQTAKSQRLLSPLTKIFAVLSQSRIDATDAPKAASQLKNLTSQALPESLTEEDVGYIADTLQKVVTNSVEGDLPASTIQDILDTVSNVSRLPQQILRDAETLNEATNRLLHTTDKLGALLKIEKNETHRRIVSGGFGLEVWDIDKQGSDDETVVGIKVLTDGEARDVEYDEMETQFSNTNVTYKDTEAAIYLPKSVLKSYVEKEDTKVRLVLNVYKDTSLYQHPGNASIDGEHINTTLNSRIIAAQLLVDGQQITDLSGHTVTIVFEPTTQHKQRTVCAFWDFSSRQGGGFWNSSGCEYHLREDGRDVCQCSHLTNFAVLISYYDQSTLQHREALGYITIIGLSLSIAGLAISILSFLCIKKLRQGRPQQTMFQLSMALLLSWVVFLVGVERTSHHAGCVAVAALLHYLILASFMWMLMEALVQYLLFVRVMNPHISHYMWKMGLPSWGLPTIPVIVTLVIDPDLYRGGAHYCWMSLQVFYYGFALPVGIIMLANLVMFGLICASLFRRADMSKHSSAKTNQTMVNIRASFISFCMLGLSWIFGFLAISDARLVFQYLFCITSSLQGFLIFLMITARDRTIRHYWLNTVCCCLKRWRTSESSSGLTPSTGVTTLPRDKKPKLIKKSKKEDSLTTTTAGLTMTSYQKNDISDEHKL
ncbi:hypothetical protein EGW08_001207 [Elysia chlorotica]|uniref:G-protein coupled receptors family 2 profile 2 domain-containing protein n=1 Tax=Elysia chlorotica TaxID=188477 RepID=A0A3S1CF51_ELYCH|nr:hypothetical protein EGW08_001207 [Elysia chlorotica]